MSPEMQVIFKEKFKEKELYTGSTAGSLTLCNMRAYASTCAAVTERNQCSQFRFGFALVNAKSLL
eukprot:584681-Pelagomonas_calceolata.AAC.1